MRVEGERLRHAAAELQDDREVVLAAVAGDGLALRHASQRLRRDKGLALEAVRHTGEALQFCEGLQDDEETTRASRPI